MKKGIFLAIIFTGAIVYYVIRKGTAAKKEA
jgi:hypothetical protein